ncbi:band 4.1-like protein 2 isoform X3 [Megalops cyprinoides]|uniref:band 4.1-like protein 2 isoform X3 n=1 Tax=Megalops cyprinoides TaxID=118141 RepID=UPI0018643EC8|nr:band 4.1-like protein 2 isoform X3 [Megalops cyprinoides]
MTTEAASETEVKKEPEKSEEQPAAAEPDAAAQTAEPAAGDGKKEPEQPKPAGNNPAGDNPGSDQPAPDGAAPPAPGEAPQNPEAPPPTSEKKKEKEQPAGKGISRFLPPWLKRQKSQSQEPPKEAPKEGSEPPAKDGEPEQGPEGKEPTPEPQPEAKEPPPEQEEKHSIGSADTQPVKEEKAEDEEVKETEEKKAEEVKKEEEQTAKPEGKPAKSPLKLTKKMKMVVCQVAMLDGTQFSCEVEKRAKGQYLFFKVCEHLNLLEKDYFGLSFKDNADQKCWLDPTKEIKRQIRSSPWQFAFNVKFYPPDPSQLTEDITRYLLCLQLRQDIASGRLPCSFVTHALLGSFSLQAELGDHDPDEHRLDYISDFQFAPSQTKELEEKVVELHKTHRGLTPAQADAQFLENAKKLSMYGVDLHHAKDSEGVDIMLGVCANGLLIYKDRLRINRFAWPKILKISYKRSNFYIKIRPGETEQFESTVGFKLPNHRAAKKVWKVCVEHHTFFRLVTPEQPQKAKFLTLGSKFRYSGRTQAQTRQASSLIDRPAPYFERTSSKRVSRSLDGAPVVSVTDSALKPDASAPALSSPVAEENGREPGLELPSDSKSKLRVKGENIYVRHSNLMLEDLDKTQEDVLKHQASISELKRSFMESTPDPRPSQWEKRLTASPATSLRLQAQGKTPPRTEAALPDGKAEDKSADVKQKPEPGELAEVEIEETVVIEEIRKAPKAKPATPEIAAVPEVAVISAAAEKEKKEEKRRSREASTSSESHSESEEEAEYHPQVASVSVEQIKEEPEEEEKEEEEELSKETPPPAVSPAAEAPPDVTVVGKGAAVVVKEEVEEEESAENTAVPADEGQNGHPEAPPEEEEEEPRVNGDASHEAERIPQVICCSEPPVVKTEMVTISDTFAAQKTEISTKEVPIVHTETKTITYEAAQLDGSGDGEPGVLMTAQTITSESLCTTTTTHITKTLKGGLSETRIEKRIVITGDSDIDHDQALAQAIKEAKEQHPDMSVTRVVVHKETELAEEGED